MKKNSTLREQPRTEYTSDIPDLDIIDLDADTKIVPGRQNSTAKGTGAYSTYSNDSTESPEDAAYTAPPEEDAYSETCTEAESPREIAYSEAYGEAYEEPDDAADEFPEDEDPFAEKESFLSKLPFKFNIHIALLAVVVIFVLAIAYKFFNWGNIVDLDEIFKDGHGTYDNTFDNILPLITQDGDPVYKVYGEDTNILFFGNAPLADDRDSKNNIVNLIQEKTGATVYNCSISGSYLAATYHTIDAEVSPIDAFNFYWLCFLAAGDLVDANYLKAVEALGENCPPEAMEVYNTLNSIDLSTIDVVTIMYDGSDYLAGHEMYSDQDFTDIKQYTGNMAAGIQLLQENYPNIRFIVMSAPYAYGLDAEGNYVSSDIQRYGQDILSTYVIKQAEACNLLSVTFIDHLYGTVNADNADDYLIDHIHLNEEGRELVADRFVKTLYYYNDRVK